MKVWCSMGESCTHTNTQLPSVTVDELARLVETVRRLQVVIAYHTSPYVPNPMLDDEGKEYDFVIMHQRLKSGRKLAILHPNKLSEFLAACADAGVVAERIDWSRDSFEFVEPLNFGTKLAKVEDFANFARPEDS